MWHILFPNGISFILILFIQYMCITIDFHLGFLAFLLSLPFMLVCHPAFPFLAITFVLFLLLFHDPLTTVLIPFNTWPSAHPSVFSWIFYVLITPKCVVSRFVSPMIYWIFPLGGSRTSYHFLIYYPTSSLLWFSLSSSCLNVKVVCGTCFPFIS